MTETTLLQQSSIKDLDWILFRDFYEKRYKMEISPEEFQTKFDDRLEIRSPGKLPNSLTSEQVKSGVSRRRNHILASYASDVIPYRGIGSGILRTLQTHPRTEFYHLPEVEQFNVVMYRPD